MYKTSDFFYNLPEELIAQTPAQPRDSSRLLVYDRKSDKVEHKIFRNVIDYLNSGDLLVVNNTKVLPARMFAYTKRIRDLREDHDKTQQEIADVLGTSQTMYARYEREANELPIRHLITLCKYYDVSSDYILGLKDTLK